MPKKSTSSRGGAYRARSKAKAFELVTDTSAPIEEELEEQEAVADISDDLSVTVADVPETPEPVRETRANPASNRKRNTKFVEKQVVNKDLSALMTPEHFAYVKKDLVTIGILTIILTAVIIGLYFYFGRV